MTRIDMVQAAMEALGESSAQELAAFVRERFGQTIEPRFVPLFIATVRDRHRLAALRRERTAASVLAETADAAPATSASPRADQARELARQLMAEHGLQDWTFGFNRRKQSMGLCVYARQTIELSIHFVERDNPWNEIRDTILHEIAHALVGPGHGHDRVWKRKCTEIGARPQRCGDAKMPEGSWKADCGGCGKCYHRHRKPKRARGWFCTECGPERGGLAWQLCPPDPA
jgi:predicted SprT family Zn-dependent metalloprotease